jgi:hypothetical protein
LIGVNRRPTQYHQESADHVSQHGYKTMWFHGGNRSLAEDDETVRATKDAKEEKLTWAW